MHHCTITVVDVTAGINDNDQLGDPDSVPRPTS
jgi:hypothetical protein